MKILFIATKCNIFKINSGGANRNNMYVKALSEMFKADGSRCIYGCSSKFLAGEVLRNCEQGNSIP